MPVNNLVFRDDFNRADTVVGGINSTTGVGNGWVDVFGSTWSISGNKALASASGIAKLEYLRYLTKGSASINQKVVFAWDSTNNFTNVYLRTDTAADTMYYFQVHPVASGASKIVVGTIVATGATVLFERVFTFVAGNIYEVTGSVENLSPTTISMSMKNLTSNTVVASVTGSDNTGSLQRSGVMALNTWSPPGRFDYIEYYDSAVPPILPSSANVSLSPYNWRIVNGVAITNNPGAYLNCTFNGTSLSLTSDNTALIAASAAATSYPKIRWSIDNAAWQNATLGSSSTNTVLASGLSAGEHQLKLYFLGIDYNLNRWTTETGFLKIVNLLPESTSVSQPAVKTKKVIIYGDSITEGLAIESSSPVTGNISVLSYAALVGEGLNAEYGQIGFGGQGWTFGGTGNTPPFSDTWDKYLASTTRLVAGKLLPMPDYLIVVHGTNDALANPAATDAAVTSAVTIWLTNARSAVNSHCKIVVASPFGGFKTSAIALGVSNYKSASGDNNTSFVDLGQDASLTSFALGSSQFSTDGIHPNVYNSSRLAAKLSNQINNVETIAVFPVTGQRLPRR